jgi:hypothetical protein
VVGGRVPADVELEAVPADWVRLSPGEEVFNRRRRSQHRR